MKTPNKAIEQAWTQQELDTIDALALQKVADSAKSGTYVSYETSVYAIRLALCQRQHDNLMMKLASLGELGMEDLK